MDQDNRVVKSRIADPQTAEGDEKINSGNAELDRILRGGLPRNRVYLIEGSPGTGKTTLALQFLLEGIQQGEPALYVSFSESEFELRQVAASHGWSLDGLNLLQLGGFGDDAAREEEYTVFHPAEVELSATTKRVIDEVKKLTPLRLAVDSLSEIRLIAREPLRYRRQILLLKEFLSQRNCTVMFLEDRTDGSDMLLESIAHGVIALERGQSEYGGVRRKLQILKMRGVDFLDGYHDYTIRRGGLNIFPRLVASQSRPAPQNPPQGALSTGIPELDQLLGGGVPWGTGVLVVGPAGAGKSVLGTQLLWAAATKGYKASAYLFEELRTTFLQRARGLHLDIVPYIETGAVHIDQVDPAELTPGEFVHRVCQRVEQENSRVVVIDTLNGYVNAMTSERFLLVQMHELLSYLNQRGVITIVIGTQHGILGTEGTSSYELTYLADLVISLRYFEAGGSVRQAISVLKNRRTSHEHTIRDYQVSERGIRIGPPLRDFRGVLSGIPVFEGSVNALLEGEGDF